MLPILKNKDALSPQIYRAGLAATRRLRYKRAMLWAGDHVGSYQILHPIGTGAMAQVFAARDQHERRAALKVLHPDHMDRPELIERFRNEARAAQVIHRATGHPGVVRILSMGELPFGVPYMAMELLGPSLDCEAHRRSPLPQERAALIARQIASALAAAHRLGIVHRDLKPGNVLFVTDGTDQVRVLDFGLAKVAAAHQGESKTVSTADSGILGTPAYAAPEQLRNPKGVTGAADVYSLGVMLYEMLSGAVPFSGRDDSAVMGRHLFEAPRPLGEVAPSAAPALCALVMLMLSKSAGARPAMDEIAVRLTAWEKP